MDGSIATIRSDAHSIALCTLILEDLLSACPTLREQAQADKMAYGINTPHTFPMENERHSTWPSAR